MVARPGCCRPRCPQEGPSLVLVSRRFLVQVGSGTSREGRLRRMMGFGGFGSADGELQLEGYQETCYDTYA